MITHLHIENFKCFKDFDIDLGPFNVLIGPNDSGKTAFLQVVEAVTANWPTEEDFVYNCCELLHIEKGRSPFWKMKMPAFKKPPRQLEVQGDILIVAYTTEATGDEAPHVEIRTFGGRRIQKQDFSGALPGSTQNRKAVQVAGNSFYLRLNPAALKRPCKLAHEMAQDGEGLGGLLLTVAGRDTDAYKNLQEEFHRKFGYQVIAHPDETGNQRVVIDFQTRFGELPASAVSDGVVISLAFLALSRLQDAPRILLVEEPENGVHHSSLKDIVGMLRDMSRSKRPVQVILTTHSPYLLDLVAPDEVRVFAKDEEGAVHAAKLSDFPDVEDMKKHFMTGEIWTTFDDSEIVAKARGKR